MRIISLLVFLIPFLSYSQNIDFADNNFKAKLIEKGVDVNNDGEVSESEALAIDSLSISSTWNSTTKIQNLDGLEFFTNLSFLNFSGNEVGRFDTSIVLPLLTDLRCNDNLLIELNIGNLPQLINLNCSDNDISFLHIENHNNLRGIDCQQNNVSSIIFKDLPKFEGGFISGGDIHFAELNNLPSLTSFHVSKIKMDTLTLTDFPKLNSLGLSTDLKALVLENIPNLEYLICVGLETDFFSINELTKLESLELPFSKIKHLNIKNGQILDELYLDQSCCIEYLCVNDFEIARYKLMMSEEGFETVINSYCTFEPGGETNLLKGTAYYNDSFDNCNTEGISIQNAQYHIKDDLQEGLFIGDETGFYSLKVKEGNYQIKPDFQNFDAFNITPSLLDVEFPGLDSIIQQDFCVVPNSAIRDLEISILPLTQASPGFETQYKVIYRNIGSTEISGKVKLFYPSNRMSFQNSLPTENIILSSEIQWNYENLKPFESRSIVATFSVNTPMDEPPVNGGDQLGMKAQILPLDLDFNRDDNLACFNQQVVNSFDPNDKICLEGKTVSKQTIGNFVHYLIRFENTGTANARNVIVKDSIDQSVFDFSSLRIIDRSHDLLLKTKSPNVVEFVFNNINLPFEENNTGYVSFKIKTLSTLNIGDVLENSAEIYFDFNFPIITNTATTVIENLSLIGEASGEIDLKFYPNPILNSVSVLASETINSIEIFNLNGQIVDKYVFIDSSKMVEINIQHLLSGYYVFKICTEDGQKLIRKLIKS